jgi:serine/threonine protein kinase
VIEVGDLVAGKYRVQRALGRGGMGYVVAAEHVQLGQPVAIKVLIPELARRAEFVSRFLREARAVAQIQSEHVVRVMDVDTLPDCTPYFVMELLLGRDLRSELVARKRIVPADAAEYVLQACEALAEAHALGIIHRDLKPANLFLRKRADGTPLVKVLDFGISKAVVPDEGQQTLLTDTHTVLGSPQYMSPEQVRSLKGIDARSDIWALGVILYELVSGKPPFSAPTPMAMFATVVSDPPLSLRHRCRDLPEGFERVIWRCLEKDPHLRFADVAELAQALKPYASGDPMRSQRIARILRNRLLPDSSSGRLEVGLSEDDTQPAADGERLPLTTSAPDFKLSASEPRASARFGFQTLLVAMAAVTGSSGIAAYLWSTRERSELRVEVAPSRSEKAPAGGALRSPEPAPAVPAAEPVAAEPSTPKPALVASRPAPAGSERRSKPKSQPSPPSASAPPSEAQPAPARDPLDGRE